MKIRCSALGKIMTNGRGQALSKTCTSYVEQVLKEEMYNCRIYSSSKYTEKGIIVEDDAIDLVAGYYGLGEVLKNEQFYENDWITGTPDIVLDDCVRDVKCSWDLGTFPIFYNAIPSKDYYWQLQGYMWLTGTSMAYLDYCLMDTPQHLIESEYRRVAYSFGQEELDEYQKIDIDSRMTFSHHPEKMRIKTFIVPQDKNAIEQIKERISQINNYISNVRTI